MCACCVDVAAIIPVNQTAFLSGSPSNKGSNKRLNQASGAGKAEVFSGAIWPQPCHLWGSRKHTWIEEA